MSTFFLPNPKIILAGFQQEAFAELLSHAGDDNYKNACLVIDGMSLKEHTEYDPHMKQVFGKVDFGGGLDLGEEDADANEALVCMLVGMRKYWKIPLAYFLVKGVSGNLLAGLIRDCLERSHEVCCFIVKYILCVCKLHVFYRWASKSGPSPWMEQITISLHMKPWVQSCDLQACKIFRQLLHTPLLMRITKFRPILTLRITSSSSGTRSVTMELSAGLAKGKSNGSSSNGSMNCRKSMV